MSLHNNDKLKKFFDALYEDKDADVSELRKDLEASGINMGRIESSVSKLLKDAERWKKLGWLLEAKKKRSIIGSMFDKQSQEIKSKFKNVRDLVQAIKKGQFGVSLQKKANAFFRNQDFKSLSDADLVSFIEDCRLLDALAKGDKEKK